ncbi:MAG TPA: cyclase family protein [Dehalococcoidia bacterium]|nr:cyclase family protein [Dehalococcoidia bacterium]
MQLFDISVPLRPGMVVYPGDTPFHAERPCAIARGDAYNLTRLQLSAHAGTHVDAPLHFIDGAPAVTHLPLGALIGPAFVVDATRISADIDAATLARLDVPAGAGRLLFKTPNSRLWDIDEFSDGFFGIADDAAGMLVALGVQLVGIDYLSLAPASDPASAHVTLLQAGVVILEGIDLRTVEPGPYQLICLPLPIEGCEGAPARAVLLRE